MQRLDVRVEKRLLQDLQKKNFMLKFAQSVIRFLPANKNSLIPAEELRDLRKNSGLKTKLLSGDVLAGFAQLTQRNLEIKAKKFILALYFYREVAAGKVGNYHGLYLQ
jgi:hypothetical protein